MKIVVLDGYTENPGDLSWSGFEALGELTVYDRTPFGTDAGEILQRARARRRSFSTKPRFPPKP